MRADSLSVSSKACRGKEEAHRKLGAMYRGSAGGPSSGMDYDPLPMNIYDSKGKKSKKSSGLAMAHLCSPMGAVITLFALAVWGPCTAPSRGLSIDRTLGSVGPGNPGGDRY